MPLPFQDPELPVDERVRDLVSRLTLGEKAAQMIHEAPPIARLGIPAYNWWNECLHGVARAGVATVFPQAIGLAATWSPRRLREVASAISDEARAKYHEYQRRGDLGVYKGLTFWSPNINILRDPRWGRGHETYGECPHLTGRLGVAFCKGLQGDDPNRLKLVATPKHFAAHSGPESLRHQFDAVVSPKDLWETYLPAFFDCVTEGQAASVMGAYNRLDGAPCCGSQRLLGHILREQWGFQGYVVSDFRAIQDLHEGHRVTADWEHSAALAVQAGCDLHGGCPHAHLIAAVEHGLLSEADLDVAVGRLFRARMLLGMFDPPESQPYASIPYETNDSQEHRELARAAARESIVLLKNKNQLLPLSRELKSIAVIGPNADSRRVLLGNYHGVPSRSVTPAEGIRAAVSATTQVWTAQGCPLLRLPYDETVGSGNLSEAVSMAERSEVVVLCLGLSADIEGEQSDEHSTECPGDRADLALTGDQQKLLETIVAVGRPTVLVLVAGCPVCLGWADEHVDAILDAWYPGEEGGTAIADVLFGDYSPAGRLPVTFPKSAEDLPDIRDYSMKGRTYRYLEREPLYPFGFGLSYAAFEYTELVLSRTTLSPTDSIDVSVLVRNVGTRRSDEVVQLYVKDLEASCRVPHHSLRAFERITLMPGQARRVSFTLGPRDLSLIDQRGRRLLEPGRFRLSVGGCQPDARSVQLGARAPLTAELTVVGQPVELPY
ncbi:MAG: glycoside hydrolase family 3 C-terminal domain-containing protein [Polyangiaceae bacterium]|nr:glycoside hydrolase family 3 C-terminal domain-containing protein [Polyangiaceae bacterium]